MNTLLILFIVFCSFFISIAVLQLYLNSLLLRKIQEITSRLKNFEHLLNANEVSQQHLEWIPTQKIDIPKGISIGEIPPALALATIKQMPFSLEMVRGSSVMLLFLDTKCSLCTSIFYSILEYFGTASPPFDLPSTIVTFTEKPLVPEMDELFEDGLRIIQVIGDKETKNRYRIERTPCTILLDAQLHVYGVTYATVFEEFLTDVKGSFDPMSVNTIIK